MGSSRLKLKDEHFEPILRQLKRYNIRYFFMIGGNDTMDTIHRVVEYARQHGYEMHGVGVCKTVDNDLFGVDHTPGFPSAARYVALSVHAGRLAGPRHATRRSVHDLPDRRPQCRLAAGGGRVRASGRRPTRRTSS